MTVPLPTPGDSDWLDWASQVDTQGRTADTHRASTANPHGVTKAQIGLGSVDNTTDAAKPVSTATTTALAGKANTSHTHGLTDLTATGTKSSSTWLRGDNTWAVLPASTTTTQGIVQLAGDLAGTAAAPTVPGLTSKVPTTQRGPIGGVATPTYAATVTPDATSAVAMRYVATGNMAVNVPTGGTDGQRIVLEVQASGANRTVTFNASYETTPAVPSRVVVVPSGTWATFTVGNRSGTWRLVASDTSAVWATTDWTLSDLGLLAWTANPILGTQAGFIPTAGGVRLSRFKLSRAATISTITVVINTAGATLTSGQCFAGIYDTSFARLAVTADQSASWTSTGAKAMALTSPPSLAAGEYYAALLTNGTTGPQFACVSTSGGAFGTIGRSSTNYLGLSADSSQTSLPTTATPSGANVLYWFGLS